MSCPAGSDRVFHVPQGTAGWNADVAQLVAHNLAKVGVASSSLVIRSSAGVAFRSDHGTWGQSTRWRGRAARHRPAKPFTRVRIPSPPPLPSTEQPSQARLAQRERASLTRKRSLVRSQYRAQTKPPDFRGFSCCPKFPCDGRAVSVLVPHPPCMSGRW